MNHSVEVIHYDDDGAAMRFTVMERPWTTNAERKGNRWERAAHTSHWRTMFAWLARSQSLPTLTDATVEIDIVQKGRLQDTAACSPAVKAAIDGLVDGGVLHDDTGNHLVSILFKAPVRGKHDELNLTISGRHAND